MAVGLGRAHRRVHGLRVPLRHPTAADRRRPDASAARLPRCARDRGRARRRHAGRSRGRLVAAAHAPPAPADVRRLFRDERPTEPLLRPQAMTSEARSIARYGWIYGLANLISRAAGILLIPVYVHALTPEEFGVYTVLIAVTEICALVFGAGVSKAMGRYFFDHEEGDPARDRVVSTTILGFGLIVVAILVLAYPLALVLTRLLLASTAYTGLFGLAIVAVAFTVLLEITQGYLVIRKMARALLVISLLRFVVVIGSNLLFVVVRGDGLAGVIHALLLSFGILSVGTAIWILRTVGVGFDLGLFGRLLAFGLPLVPSAVA
ncbi:MAG: hypothetical protein FJX57_21530, partial [Alphaproteobacteria bacterium]|nr:hypothetical protein [Alphaproteobacteria bacterium]